MSNYIVEAFKAMNLLESEDISLNQDGFDELKGFMDEAGVDPDEEMTTDVYDLEAEAEEDLKDSYLGKVVLECSVCHSDIFVDKSEVSVGTDAEALACYDIECPYCMSNEGYTIIGEIAPFNQEVADSLQEPELGEESPADDEIPAVDVEGAADDVDEEDLEESLNESLQEDEDLTREEKLAVLDFVDAEDAVVAEELLNEPWTVIYNTPEELRIYAGEEPHGIELNIFNPPVGLAESLKGDGVEELYDNQEIRQKIKTSDKLEGSDRIRGPLHKTHVNEEVESVSIETDDASINLSQSEDGSLSFTSTPKDTFEEAPIVDEVPFEGGDEMIAPLEDESVDEIEAAADANSTEEGEESIDFDALENEEEDFEDFDELSFNGLGESYLRECYENVTGFKTTGVSIDNKNLMIEGIIKFDSGNIKETQFVFESIGDGKYEGYNKQISRGKKTYKLNTSVSNKKLVCESLNYNYRSKNELNESVRVYGTIKRK